MKVFKKVLLILLLLIITTPDVYAIDKDQIKIKIGGLELDAKETNEFYVTTTFRSEKEKLELTTSEEGVEVIGAGNYDMPDDKLDIPFSFKKDGETLEYVIHISKRKTPNNPIDFNSINLYIDGKKYDVNYGYGLIIKVPFERKNVHISMNTKQEGLEIEKEIEDGYLELKENETKIHVTFKTEDDKYDYNISINKTKDVKNKETAYNNIMGWVYLGFMIIIIILLIITILFDRRNKKDKLGKVGKVFSIINICLFIIALVLFSIISICEAWLKIFTVNQVDGHSMDNTMHDGQVIVEYNKKTKYKRGDIVTANVKMYDNEKNIYICKRVIGIPGDEIEIKDNILYINGKKQNEPYIKEEMVTFDLKVKLNDDEYFLMGDNRNHSLDSRTQGPIKESQIKSKIIYRFK